MYDVTRPWIVQVIKNKKKYLLHLMALISYMGSEDKSVQYTPTEVAETPDAESLEQLCVVGYH